MQMKVAFEFGAYLDVAHGACDGKLLAHVEHVHSSPWLGHNRPWLN